MNSGTDNSVGKRVLVVEDELMIRMLLEDMLDELGYTVAAEAGRIDEAMAMARDAEFDLAILDLNLNGQPIFAGGRGADRARPAVRLRHRLWRARRAGSLSRPSDAAEAVPVSMRWPLLASLTAAK